ncbi:MAG: TetR/AcrR family transcriptional regulator [Bacteroidales bacterium]|jgi:AcrR family transcriptional regulator|nr:TetR/AcrR family transcriptional regulator [Bacteroidales bacterium]
MVAIIHDGENRAKLETILEAARKRIGTYGFEKTTMQEIAADLRISKATLYYYFPDKESLFSAVVESEMEEFFSLVRKMTQRLKRTDHMLQEYVSLRHDFFRTFVNLTRLRISNISQFNTQFRDLKTRLRREEAGLITGILRKGRETGQFSCSDEEGTALLFLEVLHGLRMVTAQNKPFPEISAEDFEAIAGKQRQFLQLFVKSLIK